ncbi:hypothetical protein IMSAG049_00884 [Clostridiales bacterium]|nr:hypothetical protein IMSAG049_00884 [Clostridiales bacterium]
MLNSNVLDCFGNEMKKLLSAYDWRDINEIRVRRDRPLILKSGGYEYFPDSGGIPSKDIKSAYRPTERDICEMMNMISDYSLYAVQEQLRHGFITVTGGHRAAVAGTVVSEKGNIMTIKNISSIALRIANEMIGCSKGVMEFVCDTKPQNVLIVSPVCGGKTTMLRDILRNLSNRGFTVGIADERGEIAACHMGIPQLDVGERTDVLDSCPKALGMSMLIRTMSPDIVSADEIGTEEDIKAIRLAALSGSAVICTAHGSDLNDVKGKLGDCLNIFNRLMFLEGRSSPGKVKAILDGRGELLC